MDLNTVKWKYIHSRWAKAKRQHEGGVLSLLAAVIAIINVKLLQVDGKNFGIWQKCLIRSVTYSTLLICCLAMQQHHSHAVCYYKYYPAMQIFRLRLLCVWIYSWAALQKFCWRGWTTTIQPDEDQRSQNPSHNMLAKSSEVIIWQLIWGISASSEKRKNNLYPVYTKMCRMIQKCYALFFVLTNCRDTVIQLGGSFYSKLFVLYFADYS